MRRKRKGKSEGEKAAVHDGWRDKRGGRQREIEGRERGKGKREGGVCWLG